MPSKAKKSPAGPAKAKLRTAGDVISRLQWSEEEDPALVLMGYDDRINGPMEKAVADYKSIDDGGDIPQHRIQYFRRTAPEGEAINMNQLMLWDREGRVDRLFGSGLGADVPVSRATTDLAFAAIANMNRIAEEREILRQRKAQERARRQRKILAKAEAENAEFAKQSSDANAQPTSAIRFHWSKTNWFDFNGNEWSKENPAGRRASRSAESNKLRCVTWNVLFDKFETETSIFDGDNARDRWSKLIQLLGEEDADLIALQEVTPAFIGLLSEAQWVREDYSVTAGTADTSSVEPYGNILLWKRRTLTPASGGLGLHVLGDGPRKRSVVACLHPNYEPSTVLMCACVHLPCDAKVCDGQSTEYQSRATARRRELNTVVGKLQVLESQFRGADVTSVVPMLLGDFNTDDQNFELQDAGFLGPKASSGIFTDVWPLLGNGRSSGHTYNPEENARARISTRGARRIDRICIGRDFTKLLRPIVGTLIGNAADCIPPSDHYGFSALLEIDHAFKQEKRRRPLLDQNAWGRTALPTTDTLLAITLDNDFMFDASSSLPVPHITLLHGFAELMSQESFDHAAQTVETVVQQTVASYHCSSIPFGRDSLSVFEHKSSATLVGLPDGCCGWLKSLYQALRASFPYCDEQESRFAEGWSPHVSLEKFGSDREARQAACKMVSEDSWFADTTSVRTQAVVIYKRDPIDRKFYAVSSIPLEAKPSKGIQDCDAKTFLVDAGASLSSYFLKASSPFMLDIERICKTTIETMSDGRLQARLKRYGSCRYFASLPAVSDIDAVVEIFPNPGAATQQYFSPSAYLQKIGTSLKLIHANAKVRIRIADSNGMVVSFLTLKVNPQSPSVDLLVCQINSGGAPLDSTGFAASSSVEDGRLVLQELGGNAPVIEIFQGALRLLKLWAYRRQIYGASLGFLGGGGWALLLARVMREGLENGDLDLEMGKAESSSNSVLSYFFQKMEQGWYQRIFTLQGTQVPQEVRDVVLARGTVAVVAPASGGDFARNTTRSTVATIASEIRRANSILRSGEVSDIFAPLSQDELLKRGVVFLALEIETKKLSQLDGSPQLPEAKSWAARQVLQVLVALESELGDAALIRPLSRPVRVKGKLLHLVRVDRHETALVEFVLKRQHRIGQDAEVFFGQDAGSCVDFVKFLSFGANQFRKKFG